jgi:hypothetical protein
METLMTPIEKDEDGFFLVILCDFVPLWQV